MNQPWIYMYSPSRSPLPPASPPNPSGSSQCTRPEHLSHASNLQPITFKWLVKSLFWFKIKSDLLNPTLTYRRGYIPKKNRLYPISHSLLHFWKPLLTSFPTNIWLILTQKTHYTWDSSFSHYTTRWFCFACLSDVVFLVLYLTKEPLGSCQEEGWWFVSADFIDWCLSGPTEFQHWPYNTIWS